jgi:cobalt-zinc-cadmium efflux system membrane fusion protein
VTINRLTAAAAAACLFAAGAGAVAVWPHRAPSGQRAGVAQPADRSAAAAPSAGVIRIAPELVARAAIAIGTAERTALAERIRVPGSVRPNGYRQVSVTPLVSGRVTRVLVTLGQAVSRGAPVAEVYSPEAADVRAKYLTAKADMAAGEAQLRRTERLAALGSASQQELERVRAEHVRHETEARQAAARLRLLGIDPARVDDPHADEGSTVIVTAPQAGVITDRPATQGMTAEPSTVLATIAELSPVWVAADVYERDLGGVRLNASATVTTTAYPGRVWHGRVTYIGPEVRAETRTVQVRIEVANPDATLKFGMYVDAAIDAARATGVTVPAAAVQMIGGDAVVFVPDETAPEAFRERRVRLGAADGTRIAIVDGLAPGERIVIKGSFELRAEAERQGVRPDASAQAVAVTITASGFEPASLALRRGVPARVTFTRTTDQTCATEVAIPAAGIRRALPLNDPVTVEFVPAAGDIVFQCGMGMLSGVMVVR